MVARSRTDDQVNAALKMVAEADAPAGDKAEMLMEIAMGLQQKPKTADDLHAAVALYQQALDLIGNADALLRARIRARQATALMATPADDVRFLEDAREALEAALETLGTDGIAAEVAEAEMNLGLVLQNLAGAGRAQIKDAISAYQRALRVFDKAGHPAEFAILQNNLATAFLSIPFTDAGGKMREALAVQAFEEGLKAVTLVDNPSEYAMLQNNLGNALQYASTSHRVENGFRALQAYDEALKVRNDRDTPGEYANTIANKANCLANLPDDPDAPEAGNAANIAAARDLYAEALGIFQATGEAAKAETVLEAIAELSDAEPISARPQPAIH